MSSEVKRWFYPAQVFAQFTASDEKSAKFVDKQECSPENMSKYTSKHCNNLRIDRDLIQIFETGEMTLAPDFAQVVIVCTSVKVLCPLLRRKTAMIITNDIACLS